MNKKIVLAAACLSLLLLQGKSRADVVGYVDFARIILRNPENIDKAKKIGKEVRLKQKTSKFKIEKENKLKLRRDEIDKAHKENKSDDEIENLKEKLIEESDGMEEHIEAAKLRRESFEKIYADFFTAVKEVAKEKGVDVVLNKDDIIIGGIDLTDLVLKKLGQ